MSLPDVFISEEGELFNDFPQIASDSEMEPHDGADFFDYHWRSEVIFHLYQDEKHRHRRVVLFKKIYGWDDQDKKNYGTSGMRRPWCWLARSSCSEEEEVQRGPSVQISILLRRYEVLLESHTVFSKLSSSRGWVNQNIGINCLNGLFIIFRQWLLDISFVRFRSWHIP